jgi:hypothetical protein
MLLACANFWHERIEIRVSLTDAYTVAVGRVPDLFAKIQDGQAPEVFTVQLLKDWGFTSSNDRAALPLLKELGFLSAEGRPTPRYHEYRNHSQSKSVMAEAIREAYSDLFLIKANPSKADRAAIEGKFKSYHNVSDNVASLMAKTFFALLDLADLNATRPAVTVPGQRIQEEHSSDIAKAALAGC